MEPLVIAKLEKDDIEFLVDTEVACSVLNTLEGKPSHNTAHVGATGVKEIQPFYNL